MPDVKINKFRSLSSTSPPGSLCSKRLKSNPCCADSAAHGSVTPSSTLPMVLSSARATRPITLWKRCQAFLRTAVLSLQLEPEDALLILGANGQWNCIKGFEKGRTKKPESWHAIREEQGYIYNPRVRDTSCWHIFWSPRNAKRKTRKRDHKV